jgi:hypothetical protein
MTRMTQRILADGCSLPDQPLGIQQGEYFPSDIDNSLPGGRGLLRDY